MWQIYLRYFWECDRYISDISDSVADISDISDSVADISNISDSVADISDISDRRLFLSTLIPRYLRLETQKTNLTELYFENKGKVALFIGSYMYIWNISDEGVAGKCPKTSV